MKNDVSYSKYIDSGSGGMRYSADSDVDQQPSDDSDVSAAPRSRSKGASKASRSRGPKVRTLNRWSPEEHERLAFLVAKWGSEKNWAKVAEEMPGRTGKQCRERWLNHMKPGIIKGNWSFEEEFLLAQCHAVVGSHWSKMTKRLPGRTENSIKNFWNATLRSKAPHKRRGMLWLYMQQQTCQEGENVDAFLVAVTRLYESQELPGAWAQLMDEGRLTERTLRAVLRAEKDFLENPDTELHPLALPHPTHGLSAAADADAATTGAAAAAAAAAGADADADTGYEAPPAPQGATVSAAAFAPAAAAAGGGSSSFQPVSPLPAPGLTPRCPGVDQPQGGSGRSSGVPCSAAFDGLGLRALGGLALPPEVLAALGPQEAWASLTSAQVPAGLAYGAAPGSMEPLMPTLGLPSDMHPSGHQPAGQGAFGGALAPGHDTIWTCLPSLRGLCNTGFGAGTTPAAGSFTPHAAIDPLKLLEPYGALTGHHSSVSMCTRPDSALELEHPAQRQATTAAAVDSQGISRHSSSRPGSSMGTHVMLPASMTPPGELAAISAAFQQQQQGMAALGSRAVRVAGGVPDDTQPSTSFQGTAGQQGQYSPEDVTGHHVSSSALTHAWMRQGTNHHQPPAAGQHAARDVVRSGDSSCLQPPSERGSSPADSATHSELAYGTTGQQQQQQHMLSHHAAAGGHPAPAGGMEQLCSVLSAPLPIASLKHAHSSTQSPFARHASTGWDTEGAAQAAGTEAAAAAASLQELQQGRSGLQHEAEAHPQPQTGRHALQLGPLMGATAAGLFSPRSVDSPMTGALQQLLDSAAAHACLRAQDICAWLASANTGQLPTQLRPQQQDNKADQAPTDLVHALGQSVPPAREDSSNVNSTNPTSGGAQEAHACSILENLLGPHHSAQLSDMLLSPAGLFSTAALLQGSLPPTPAAGHTSAAALQGPAVGVKRERSLPDAQEELLIEQPGHKMPRVF